MMLHLDHSECDNSRNKADRFTTPINQVGMICTNIVVLVSNFEVFENLENYRRLKC